MDRFVRTLYEGETSGEYTVDYMLINLCGFDAERVTIADGLVGTGRVTETHNLLEVRGGSIDCGALAAGERKHCSLRVVGASSDTGAVARFCGSAACVSVSAVAPKP